MKQPSRPAYGLFQLLVVLAILLLLVGMLLPAVQKVRLAAARMKSQNNLKQMGLAIHSFHDTINKVPVGVNDKHFSVLFHLLPYIEQDNLYKIADTNKNCDDKDNAKVRSTRVVVFESNLDPLAEKFTPGGTSYFAVAGTKMSLSQNDGAFFRDSNIRFANISDGLSNTVAFVEMLRGDDGKKAESVSRQHVRLKDTDLPNLKFEAGVKDFKDNKNIVANRGSAWIDGRFLQATTNGTRGMADPKPDVDCGGDGGLAGVRIHPDGTNVLMFDGSVRWINPQLTLQTWHNVCAIADGNVIGNDF